MQYLNKLPNTQARLGIKGNSRKQVISRTYYWKENQSVGNDFITITTYLFGSGVSHARSYLLIKINRPRNEEYCIVDDNNLENGIQSLLNLVKDIKLVGNQKTVLVNQLSAAYNKP